MSNGTQLRFADADAYSFLVSSIGFDDAIARLKSALKQKAAYRVAKMQAAGLRTAQRALGRAAQALRTIAPDVAREAVELSKRTAANAGSTSPDPATRWVLAQTVEELRADGWRGYRLANALMKSGACTPPTDIGERAQAVRRCLTWSRQEQRRYHRAERDSAAKTSRQSGAPSLSAPRSATTSDQEPLKGDETMTTKKLVKRTVTTEEIFEADEDVTLQGLDGEPDEEIEEDVDEDEDETDEDEDASSSRKRRK